MQGQTTKRKAPGSRAKKAKPPGVAATNGKRQRRKPGLAVIQEGMQSLSPAPASPLSSVQQRLPPQQLLTNFLDVDGLTIPELPLQGSCMPCIADSHPSSVSLHQLDAMCMMTPGSYPTQNAFSTSQNSTTALHNPSPQPLGSGGLGLACLAQTLEAAVAHTIHDVGHLAQTPSSVPISAYSQSSQGHEMRQADDGNSKMHCTFSPLQLAGEWSQQTNLADGSALQSRSILALELPGGVQQVTLAPVQGIPVTSRSALQQSDKSTQPHDVACPAAALGPIMGPAHILDAQSHGQHHSAAAATVVSVDVQADPGMGSDVMSSAVPSRMTPAALLAGRHIAADPAISAPDHDQMRGLQACLQSFKAAAPIAQPGGMTRPQSASIGKLANDLSMSIIDRAKSASDRSVPPALASSELFPNMIPAAARDIAQAPSVASGSAISDGFGMSMQMLTLEHMMPMEHHQSHTGLARRQVPSSGLQLGKLPVPTQMQIPDLISLGLDQGLCQLSDGTTMQHHASQLGVSEQPRRPSPGHGIMSHQPCSATASNPQGDSALQRQDVSNHIAEDLFAQASGPDITPAKVLRLGSDNLSTHHEHAQTIAAAAAIQATAQAAQVGQGILDAQDIPGAGLHLQRQPSLDMIKLEASVARARRKFLQARLSCPVDIVHVVPAGLYLRPSVSEVVFAWQPQNDAPGFFSGMGLL